MHISLAVKIIDELYINAQILDVTPSEKFNAIRFYYKYKCFLISNNTFLPHIDLSLKLVLTSSVKTYETIYPFDLFKKNPNCEEKLNYIYAILLVKTFGSEFFTEP
jgi:hypothetical protein